MRRCSGGLWLLLVLASLSPDKAAAQSTFERGSDRRTVNDRMFRLPRPAPGEKWDPAMLSTHYHGIHIPEERIGAYIYSLNRSAFGANEATSLTTEADLDINGLKVPAGSYTLYVFPEANQWQLVVNKQTGQWGTVYNKGQDLGRVKMTMSKTTAPVETYKMTLSGEGGNKGKLTLEWENIVASVPFTVQ